MHPAHLGDVLGSDGAAFSGSERASRHVRLCSSPFLTDCKTSACRNARLRCQFTFDPDVVSNSSQHTPNLAATRANRTLQTRDRCVRFPQGRKEPGHRLGIVCGPPGGPYRAQRLQPDIARVFELAPSWSAAQIHTPVRSLHRSARIVRASSEVAVDRAVGECSVRDHSSDRRQHHCPDREPAPVRARPS